MSTEQSSGAERARTGRMVRLKSAFYFFAVLVIVFLAVLLVNSRNCRREMNAQALASARSLAASVAIFGNRLIVDRSYSDLQDRCDELVQGSNIAYVAVSDAGGQIVVHTNREFRGRNKDDITPPAGVAWASQSVMSRTKQVGTVYVGIRLK